MSYSDSVEDMVSDQNIQAQTENNYTRVTEILSPFSGLDHINPTVLENACRRGTMVHDTCEGIVRGLGEWNVTEETQGYIESFNKWWSADFNVLSIEQRFFCDDLQITGKVDYIIENDDGSCNIVDLKTSAKASKTWPLQGSAYAYMARKAGYNVRDIVFIRLSKYGLSPVIHVYDDMFELFRQCLDVYNYFFKPKKPKKSYE